jgi:hypothetical protein
MPTGERLYGNLILLIAVSAAWLYVFFVKVRGDKRRWRVVFVSNVIGLGSVLAIGLCSYALELCGYGTILDTDLAFRLITGLMLIGSIVGFYMTLPSKE